MHAPLTTAPPPSFRTIWTIAYPILLSLVMEQLIGLTDTAFLGRVGEVELGASALAGIYYLAIFMVAFGFSIGAQIIIGRRNGEGNYRRIGAIFYQGLYFLLVLAGVMFFLSYHWSEGILRRIIDSEAVYTATASYMRWRVAGFFFSFAAVMFRAFFVGTTQTRTLAWNGLVMVLSNVAFNYVLIFGKLGVPALGIAGAAIGSSLAEMVSLLFFILYTRRRVDVGLYGLDRPCGIRWRILGRVLGVSVWTMIQNFLSMATWFIFFLSVEHLGERPLAVTNLVRNVSALVFIIIMAFAATCSTLVSNEIGAGHPEAVRPTVRRTIGITYRCALPLVVLIALVPTIVLRLFTDEGVLIQAAVPSLWVYCTSVVVSIPAFVLFQAVSGTGNTRSALLLESVALVVYVVYVWWMVFHLRSDVAVAWTSEHVYSFVMMLLSLVYLRYGRWQRRKI